MIKITDIYKSVNALLISKYNYKIHGHEVVEGFDTPSFFVTLIPRTISNTSVRYKEYAYTIMITYFQEIPNEIDNLQKIDEIQELFGYHLQIGERKVKITDFDYDFVGEETNVLQMSIEIEYLDAIERIETQPKASEIILREERE